MRIKSSRSAAWPRVLVLAIGLAPAACAQNTRPAEPGASGDVAVTVENQNFKDAVVYAIWDSGPRSRLGMVTGNTTQTFTTATRGSGEMRLEVELIAGNDVITERMGVYQGENIHVVIPSGI
jgi:hypothetical protein